MILFTSQKFAITFFDIRSFWCRLQLFLHLRIDTKCYLFLESRQGFPGPRRGPGVLPGCCATVPEHCGLIRKRIPGSILHLGCWARPGELLHTGNRYKTQDLRILLPPDARARGNTPETFVVCSTTRQLSRETFLACRGRSDVTRRGCQQLQTEHTAASRAGSSRPGLPAAF